MATMLSSTQNPLIKEVRSLCTKKGRREAGLTVVEGVHPLEEALRAGWQVPTVLHTERFAERPEGAALLGRLSAAGARLVGVTEEVLAHAADTETPQGVLGTVRPRVMGLAELAEAQAGVGAATGAGIRAGLLLVCDGLQDPGNLGTLWRAAHAFGAAGLVLTSNTVEPFSPKVIRAATGSVFHLPVAVAADPGAALAALQGAGWRVAVADAARGQAPDGLDLTGRLALVIGNEGNGPAAAWQDGADLRLRIPMPGNAESLNAGVAGSILLYEAARQRLASHQA